VGSKEGWDDGVSTRLAVGAMDGDDDGESDTAPVGATVS